MMRFPIIIASVIALTIANIPCVLAGKPNVVGYYASWEQSEMTGVDFSKYTHINLSFAVPAKDGSISFDKTLPLGTTVKEIQSKGAKALVSIGGWSDSVYFTDLVSDTSTSNLFITNIVNFVNTNNLDGVDIDWEFPGLEGSGCNHPNLAKDTPNYLTFLTNLRAAFTSKFGAGKKLITMAVRIQPFDVNGSPTNDVSGFAKVADYINLMQYDINGAWMDTTGPNAPLNFQQGKATQLSYVSAIDAWTSAGWPAKQINAGLAFYGRSTVAKEDMTKDPTNQYQAQEKGVIPQGDQDDAKSTDPCTKVTSYSGIWQWKNLRAQGVLTSTEAAASPWVRQWDSVSQTPWLFNPKTNIFLSYDDPKSIAAKVDYAKTKGLAGSMVWAMYMDYNGELLDTVVDTWGSESSSSSSTDSTSAVSVTVKTSTNNVASSDNSSSSCSDEYAYKCDAAGSSVVYYVCLQSTWVKMSCGAGTVCEQNGNYISCGFSSS